MEKSLFLENGIENKLGTSLNGKKLKKIEYIIDQVYIHYKLI